MTDEDRLEELPAHLRAEVKSANSSVDFLRLGEQDLEGEGDQDAEE